MDKIAKEEFVSAILASNILAPYLAQDPDLVEIVKTPDHPEIHFFDSSGEAKQIGLALKQRLDQMVSRNIQHNLEATRQLVAFSEEHPDSEMYNVTFNSQTRHYGVRCSRVEGQVHVICVMLGGRLSDALLGQAAP